MKLVGLSVYSFCVRDAQDIEYELHDILGYSFIEIIYNAANIKLQEYENDEDDESVFTFDEIRVEDVKNADEQVLYNCLLMRVKTGEYGVESEIINSETGDLAHVKQPNEADVMPFGCGVIVPAGMHTNGILLFQSIGRFGIVTVMKKYLDDYLKSMNDGLRLVVEPLYPREYASKLFEEGILKKIRFIRYEIPDDDADRYGLDRNVKEVIEERIIRNPAGFLRNKGNELRRFLNRECDMIDIVKIEDYEIDDLKFEFKCGKRLKTISLRNLDNLIVSEDITNLLIIVNGHPTFDSLCEVIKETGEYYLRAKGALV